MRNDMYRGAAAGVAGALLQLGSYVGLLTLGSGWSFTVEQFATYGSFIVVLAVGFGVQIALFVYLRRLVRGSSANAKVAAISGTTSTAAKVVAISGTTSTAAMVSCCTHYLANVLPIVGAVGLFTLATQYQVELLWLGLAFNAAGIAYIGSKIVAATREHARCSAPA